MSRPVRLDDAGLPLGITPWRVRQSVAFERENFRDDHAQVIALLTGQNL